MDVLASRVEHAAHGHVLEGLAATPRMGALRSGKRAKKAVSTGIIWVVGGFRGLVFESCDWLRFVGLSACM